MIGDGESDRLERWLADEFESPAEAALARATANEREPLTPSDWMKLVNFLAAQDVRTPAALIERIQDWDKNLQARLQTALEDTKRRMERGELVPRCPEKLAHIRSAELPIHFSTSIKEGEDTGVLQAGIMRGRSLWHWEIEHRLRNTVKVLRRHAWTILRPPAGMSWLTSDSPVMRVNWIGPNSYDFKGGWGSSGTEIMMPLGPQHLMYTAIGFRPPLRGESMPEAKAVVVQTQVAEHAHRMIFATEQDKNAVQYRPRIEDADSFRREQEQWRAWPHEQSAAEFDLLAKSKAPLLSREAPG